MLASYSLGKEGMGAPHLDTLVLATPVSDVEQCVGRVLRYKEGKKTPFILDYTDPNEAFDSMRDRRLNYYRDNNYPIKHVIKS